MTGPRRQLRFHRRRYELHEFRQHTGKRVVYLSVATRRPTEIGIVSHVDEKWVHVHYEDSPGPLATHPDNLRLVVER